MQHLQMVIKKEVPVFRPSRRLIWIFLFALLLIPLVPYVIRAISAKSLELHPVELHDISPNASIKLHKVPLALMADSVLRAEHIEGLFDPGLGASVGGAVL